MFTSRAMDMVQITGIAGKDKLILVVADKATMAPYLGDFISRTSAFCSFPGAPQMCVIMLEVLQAEIPY